MERRGQGCSQVSCLEVINTRIHVEEHGGGWAENKNFVLKILILRCLGDTRINKQIWTYGFRAKGRGWGQVET